MTATTERSALLRRFFARCVATKGGATDPRIEGAFATIPREPFAGPAPWSVFLSGPWVRGGSGPGVYVETPSDDPAFLYQDTLIALDAARGINIGEPSLHARCLDQLAPQAGDVVLHVGAGSGYYTALLAHLVGPHGRVHAFEIDPELAARASRNLADVPIVDVHARSGIADDLPMVDRIYVNAGTTQPSRSWLDALRPGRGRLMFPLQPAGRYGGMLLVERPEAGEAWPARFVTRAGFILCEGTQQDDEVASRLAEAFARGNADEVRSLRLASDPDDTCWCAGDDWWLSTASALRQEIVR